MRFFSIPDRWQSNTLLTIDGRGSQIHRNSVFDCQLSPVGGQTAIEISVSNDLRSTFVDSINVFDCRLSEVFIENTKYVVRTIRNKGSYE